MRFKIDVHPRPWWTLWSIKPPDIVVVDTNTPGLEFPCKDMRDAYELRSLLEMIGECNLIAERRKS